LLVLLFVDMLDPPYCALVSSFNAEDLM